MAEKIILSYETKDKSSKPLIKQIIPEYTVYQLTPDRFIEGGKMIEEILTTITALPDTGLRFENKCLVLDKFQPVYYEIFFDKSNISFNYAIPKSYDKVLKNKVQNVFKSATFKPRENGDYFNEFYHQYYCTYGLDKHFMFSLNSDYRENGLVEAFLGMADNILGDDKLLLQIGIVPANDEMWKQEWENTYKKFKAGEKIQSYPTLGIAVAETLSNVADGAVKVCDAFLGVKVTPKDQMNGRMMDMFDMRKGFKHTSQMKKTYNGYVTQIKLFCNNPENAYYYFKTMNGILKLLDGDNTLKLQKVKMHKKESRTFEAQITKNILSQKELSHFMQMPNRRMQMEYKKVLTSIETREINVPAPLLDPKGLLIGDYVYKGTTRKVYFPSDKDNSDYSELMTGFMRVGKTSAMVRRAIDCLIKGQSCFVVDTIQGCDLSNKIRDFAPEDKKHKIVVLDYSNTDYLLPLSWHEIDLEKGSNKDKMMKASMIAGAFESFLDTCFASRDEDKLSPRMKRILSSACKLVLTQKGTTINDIIYCLTDYAKRHEFISNTHMKHDDTTVQTLLQLDTKEGGTNFKDILGIIDRISVLTNDYLMELMLGAPINPELNFKYWADNGYCVLLKIPENCFSNLAISALVTFTFNKIWLSILERNREDVVSGKYPSVRVIADEIHKYPEVCKQLVYWIREGAKYKTSFVISAHSLSDLKSLLPIFRASGANYSIFKTSSQNLKYLEKEIFPFEIDEVINIPKFHTFNIINYANGEYTQFVSKLPPEVKDDYPFVDRSYLDLEFSKKYGFEFTE